MERFPAEERAIRRKPRTQTAVEAPGPEAADDQARVRAVVRAARKKKAFDVKVLDLSGLTFFTDYFIIVSGSTVRQVSAIAEAVLQEIHVLGAGPASVEGASGSEWVLIDSGAFIVHIFTPSRREFYDLERLWADAREWAVPEDDAPFSVP